MMFLQNKNVFYRQDHHASSHFSVLHRCWNSVFSYIKTRANIRFTGDNKHRLASTSRHRNSRDSHQQTYPLRLHGGSTQYPHHSQHRICLQIPLRIYQVRAVYCHDDSNCLSLYSYFVTCVNRLLPVGIVLFRYVYVCKVRKNYKAFLHR